jgi:glyoxylase-like metal-dependent hydrolase (beta-lactamase superfamily II)
MEYRIISIGATDMHPLWGERVPVRTGHATTTLLISGSMRLLVDPGLPGSVLEARLSERANLKVSDITHVFLTSFQPDVRRGLPAFDGATWWIGETERETYGVPLANMLRRAAQENDRELVATLEPEIALLQRCKPAPDELADNLKLFPLPGVTPGMCGLILSHQQYTLVIAGDAVPTVEHLEQGKAPQRAVDIDQARSSLAEVIEIADFIIPGRDNLVINPTRRPF